MGGEVKNYKLESSPFAFPTVASLKECGAIEGRFFTPTEARGTIKIYLGVLLSKSACELGTFPWNAKSE